MAAGPPPVSDMAAPGSDILDPPRVPSRRIDFTKLHMSTPESIPTPRRKLTPTERTFLQENDHLIPCGITVFNRVGCE